MDLATSPKKKTTKRKRIKGCSLVRSTSKVEGHAGVSRWDLED